MQNRIVRAEVVMKSKKYPDKYCVVKDANGDWLEGPIGMLDRLMGAKGTDIELVVEQNERGYWKIKGFANGAAPARAASAPAQVAPYRPPVDDPTPERIYVCGIVNSAITSQQVNPMDPAALVAVTNAARQAWSQTLGAKVGAQVPKPAVVGGVDDRAAREMDDTIPFS